MIKHSKFNLTDFNEKYVKVRLSCAKTIINAYGTLHIDANKISIIDARSNNIRIIEEKDIEDILDIKEHTFKPYTQSSTKDDKSAAKADKNDANKPNIPAEKKSTFKSKSYPDDIFEFDGAIYKQNSIQRVGKIKEHENYFEFEFELINGNYHCCQTTFKTKWRDKEQNAKNKEFAYLKLHELRNYLITKM